MKTALGTAVMSLAQSDKSCRAIRDVVGDGPQAELSSLDLFLGFCSRWWGRQFWRQPPFRGALAARLTKWSFKLTHYRNCSKSLNYTLMKCPPDRGSITQKRESAEALSLFA
jgi:hypothetical protein